MRAVMNGANEVAVEAFLRKEIGFLDIPDIIERVMSVHEPFPVDSIASVMEADRWARQKAEDIIKSIQG